ncbi:membrane protein [Fulvitalea axinellae]|uniref:Membrane protein n=1 Tax=Fulvitalea axinellae TaxID=1182444 RepID=A0AAU9CUK0_9BACT|nr:membrane protein [Fulvitalea axinellae]
MRSAKSSNPVFRRLAESRTYARDVTGESAMTIQGAAVKTLILLLITFVSAMYTYAQTLQGAMNPSLAWGGAIVGFILAMITVFKANWSPYTTPLYALCEGLFLGIVSATFEASFPGVVLDAVLSTFGVLFTLLALYATRVVKVTNKFRMIVFAATGGVAAVYLITWIFSFFGVHLPYMFGSGLSALIFTAIVAVVAALNLLMDFDFIEQGAEAGMPKYMEWYGAFGLMVSLIWLYLEILRLLAILRGRD